ncbi:MAG: hypothetical protein QOG28_2217 [Trebonia sp.]|jgi:pimeloyl-ACP methyl ester carboxylesterase|nr:hypothetical protein [Trebonia sp.]
MFDRRESGASDGRVERVTWADYAAQGKGLLDNLAGARAHLMGGCVGCSAVAVFAATWPQAAASRVLYSPRAVPGTASRSPPGSRGTCRLFPNGIW